MDDIEKEVLKENKKAICKDLIAVYIVDHLVDNHILNEEDKKEILTTGHSVGDVRDYKRREFIWNIQNEKLFVKLFDQIKLKKGRSICKALIDAFNYDDCYPWLARKLKQSLDEKMAKQYKIEVCMMQ